MVIIFDLHQLNVIDSGGSSVLPETMAKHIKDKLGQDPIIMNAPVTSIGLEDEKRLDSPIVVVAGDSRRSYSHVISTLPLPVLRTIDMKQCKLDLIQKTALRQLQYGPSIKIGILFTENWWTIGKDKDGVAFNIVGGQSTTDLPIRTIVYPSHGAHTNEPSKTLMASYCWTSDAQRLGTWFKSGDQTNNKRLKHLVLENLAAVHNVTYEYLESRFLAMHAWDWNHYEFSMGKQHCRIVDKQKTNVDTIIRRVCPFRSRELRKFVHQPHQTSSKWKASYSWGSIEYPSWVRLKSTSLLQLLIFYNYSWVVGALDSAWRAVYDYLYLTDKKKIPELVKRWGTNREWFHKKYDEVPEPDMESPVDGPDGVDEFISGNILEQYIRSTRKGY